MCWLLAELRFVADSFLSHVMIGSSRLFPYAFSEATPRSMCCGAHLRLSDSPLFQAADQNGYAKAADA